MIPILFDNTETEFTSNGLGRLADCISCTVTEELNGIYECQLTYPVSGEMYPLIQEGCIIGVIHDDVHDVQPFDIYGRSAPLNGVVTFYAHHISYRLGNIVLKPMTASSCAAALAAIPNQTYTECPFTFWTDKSVSATWKNEVPSAVKAILGGQEGSILDVYGKGEYEWDKWTVKLYTNRGVDNGVSIRYGVNLTDLKHDIDISGAYTAAVPYWKSTEDDTVVTLDSGYVKVNIPQLVAWTDNNGEEIVDDQGRVIYFNAESSRTSLRTTVMDLSEAFQEQPTQAQLRTEALRRLTNSEAWLPSENITVKFVDLAHTEEYKAVAALQRVRLCDRVSVYCGPLGVSAVSMQVIRVVFNVLTERYDEIELGKARTSFAEALMKDVSNAVADLPTAGQVKSMLATAVDNATSQITGANGGHVRFIYDANGDPQEILIMDTDNIETAVNVWRRNSGGLGFSSHGYAGPYSTAITADGKFVANFITVGELTANILKSGIIDGDLVYVKKLTAVDDNGNEIASFKDDIILGDSNDYHATITKYGFSIYAKKNRLTSYQPRVFMVRDFGDNNAYVKKTKSISGDGTTKAFRLFCYLSPQTDVRNIVADTNIPYTISSSNIGGVKEWTITFSTAPSRSQSISVNYEIKGTIPVLVLGDEAAENQYTIGVGYLCFARGLCSAVFGIRANANGVASRAEGMDTSANGDTSHAEGDATTANGYASHSEGYDTKANSYASHAEGYRTIASGEMQHVFGCLNVANSNYLEIVGNGIKSESVYVVETRKNARTLDWSGNEWIAGTLTQASDARLKEESGEVPDLSSIRARRFRWNGKKGIHDDKDHIGYFAQDVENVAPYLVDEDASGYKSLDYIALLCAKVDALERKVAELEKGVK